MLDWLESHLVLIPLEPRKPGCSVVVGKDITESKVKDLANAAEDCWNAIMAMDLSRFASAYRASFAAQIAMFPAMVNPVVNGEDAPRPENSIQPHIDKWSAVPGVLAWKMPGAGGGGYLALVVEEASAFASAHAEAIILKIRRK